MGLITTAVNRQNANAAYVNALDWDLKLAKGRYQITGTLATSQLWQLETRKSGYLAHLEFDKRGGWWLAESSFKMISPDFEINDLGFLRRADLIAWNYTLSAEKRSPFSIFRRIFFRFYGWQNWNYQKVNISRHFRLSHHTRFKNYWDVNLRIEHNLESFNDDDVRRGGTLIKNPTNSRIYTRLSTDDRKIIRLELNPVFDWNHDRQSYDYNLRLYLRIRPASNIEFSVGPSYSYRVKEAQWVKQIEKNLKKHYTYGKLKSRTLDFTT